MTEALATVRSLLPDGVDLHSEDGFVQAGQLLVDIGRQAFIGLGELLAWKIEREQAQDRAGREQIIARYAAAWGVSRSNLTKALVNVQRFPDVARPQDHTPTLSYEILSGSDSAEEAEAGFDAATANGWGVRQAREAKALKRQGHTELWQLPHLFWRDGAIWARGDEGREVLVMAAVPSVEDDTLIGAAVGLIRYRTGT
jgi:hypothetical protein